MKRPVLCISANLAYSRDVVVRSEMGTEGESVIIVKHYSTNLLKLQFNYHQLRDQRIDSFTLKALQQCETPGAILTTTR